MFITLLFINADPQRSVVPPKLVRTLEMWEHAGRPPQPPSRWSRKTWLQIFPEHETFLRSVPDLVGRAEAAALAANATEPDGAVEAFLVSMIWGFGPVGYGAWRTRRVLEENPGSDRRLSAIATAVRDSALEGFREVSRAPLKHLGVAFGTKYLYFCGLSVAAAEGDRVDQRIAPVLDSVVRRWMWDEARVNLRIGSWRTSDYARYLDQLDAWGNELGCRRDVVEELIFRSRISDDGSRFWGEAWAASSDQPLDARRALQQLRDSLLELSSDGSVVDKASSHLKGIEQIINRLAQVDGILDSDV